MDNTTKHTPGPWKSEPIGTNHKSTKEKGMAHRITAFENGNGRLAWDIAATYYKEQWEEAEANANVLAAAPDLLEALEDCVQWITANISAMGSMVYGGVNLAEIWLNENKTLQKANAAIAKTKGE